VEVEDASRRPVRAVAVDFWGVAEEGGMLEDRRVKGKSPIVQDIINNMIVLKEVPSWAAVEPAFEGRVEDH